MKKVLFILFLFFLLNPIKAQTLNVDSLISFSNDEEIFKTLESTLISWIEKIKQEQEDIPLEELEASSSPDTLSMLLSRYRNILYISKEAINIKILIDYLNHGNYDKVTLKSLEKKYYFYFDTFFSSTKTP